MRVVKEAEERRNEILDAADELFGAKGFDGTSTNDILSKVGIARGTLYYHFKSKEDIMDALIDRYNTQLLTAARKIAQDKGIPVRERLVRSIMALKLNSTSGREITQQMHRNQNALMHQKVQKIVIRGVTPILSDLIREGIEDKIFSTPYPYECMEIMVTYASTVFDEDDIIAPDDERQPERITAFVYNLERLLGAEEGSLAEMVGLFK